jgi:hypothetical protein
MPLTEKGKEILSEMEKPPSEGGYGEKKGEQVFYASKNKGTISGVDGGSETYNEEKMHEAARSHEVQSHDYTPVGGGSITLAEINRQGNEFWAGQHGNVGSAEGSASTLPSEGKSNPVPVYKGMQDAADEVSPTQSDPPDSRSDNLLSKEHGGMDDGSLVEWAKEEEVEKEHGKDAQFEVTREFTGGVLKGLSHTAKTNVEMKQGTEVKKPIGGGPYKITKVKKVGDN